MASFRLWPAVVEIAPLRLSSVMSGRFATGAIDRQRRSDSVPQYRVDQMNGPPVPVAAARSPPPASIVARAFPRQLVRARLKIYPPPQLDVPPLRSLHQRTHPPHVRGRNVRRRAREVRVVQDVRSRRRKREPPPLRYRERLGDRNVLHVVPRP